MRDHMRFLDEEKSSLTPTEEIQDCFLVGAHTHQVSENEALKDRFTNKVATGGL